MLLVSQHTKLYVTALKIIIIKKEHKGFYLSACFHCRPEQWYCYYEQRFWAKPQCPLGHVKPIVNESISNSIAVRSQVRFNGIMLPHIFGPTPVYRKKKLIDTKVLIIRSEQYDLCFLRHGGNMRTVRTHILLDYCS